jgi:hypothetical protein
MLLISLWYVVRGVLLRLFIQLEKALAQVILLSILFSNQALGYVVSIENVRTNVLLLKLLIFVWHQ